MSWPPAPVPGAGPGMPGGAPAPGVPLPHAQANPTSRPLMRRWLLWGAVVLGSLASALFFAYLFADGYGLTATLLGLVFAVLPLGIVLPLFLWLDRFEAEPLRYVLTAFLYGALGATLFALIFNELGHGALGGLTDPSSADVLTAVLVAPLTEETFKGIFVLAVALLRRRQFNGLTDGLVYAGIVATGFAFTENILYLAQSYVEFGGAALVATFVVRGLFTPFLHPMFTAMTGIGIGIAATSRSGAVRVIAPIVGWCAAVLLHGLWNLSASSGVGGVLVGLMVGLVVFVAFVGFVVWARVREGRLIGTHLRPYAATGWLTPAEVEMLATMPGRRRARAWARSIGGAPGQRTMQAFQDAGSELALLRARMHRHAADAHALHTERVLLESMTARRRELLGVRGV